MSLQIHPSLFIGIGTNGWKIVDELRELFFEEFGAAGLPCFRYIAIETNLANRGDDNIPGRNLYEKVKPVYITLPKTAVLRQRLNPADKDNYNPNLAAWLDPELPERGEGSYTAGAGNSRQVGRVCLWENWRQTIANSLRLAYTEVMDGLNRRSSADSLRRYLEGKGEVNVPGDLVALAPRIYIFGTLCGGTCSGTFIDLAYFVSEFVRNVDGAERIGMFTIVDTMNANGSRLAANCAAALHELDYYCGRSSVYSAEFPDGTRIQSRNEPFDTVYLVSMRNMQSVGFKGKDTEELTKMCAMNLFTEVVAGMADKKAEGRVDLKENIPGYGKPTLNDGYLRTFSSFGMAAISYPRYRIAQAINRQLAVEMCNDWLAEDPNKGKIEDEAKTAWETMIRRAKGSFLGTSEGAHNTIDLVNEVLTAFRMQQAEFEATVPDALDGIARHFPKPDSTFTDKFAKPKGEYYRRMSDVRDLVLKDLKKNLTECAEAYLRDHTTKEAALFVSSLLDCAVNAERSLPDELPQLDQTLNLGLSEGVHGDLWSKLLRRKLEAVAEYRTALWENLKNRVLKHMDLVRDTLVRVILPGVQEHLRKMGNEVKEVEGKLENLRDECKAQRAQKEILPHHNNVLIVSAEKMDSIHDDVDMGKGRIISEKGRQELRRLFIQADPPITSSAFISAAEIPGLVARVDACYGDLSRKVVSEFKISSEKLAEISDKTRELVVSSHPYIEPITGWQRQVGRRLPNFVFSSDESAGQGLVTKAAHDFPANTSHYSWEKSPLDHFVFLYQECCAIAISDLAFFQQADKALREIERAPDKIATSYTHRAGRSHFSIESAEKIANLQHWIEAMAYLDGGLFDKNGSGQRCITFTGLDRMIRVLNVDDLEQLKSLLGEHGEQPLFVVFEKRLKDAGKDVVVDRMNNALKSAPPTDQMPMQKLHEAILKRVFPN